MEAIQNQKDNAYLNQKIIKYYGPAGTGKTTALKYKVYEEIIENGIEPCEIAFLTFTKKEARHGLKVVAELGFEIKELKWFRTIHSTCYKLLELEKINIVTEKQKIQFFKTIEMDYSSSGETNIEAILDGTNGISLDELTITNNQIKEGNIYLSIIDWCRQNYPYATNPLDHYHQCPIVKNDHLLSNLYKKDILKQKEISKNHILSIDRKYNSFKNSSNLFDFTDLLFIVFQRKLYPDVKILIIDEAQDLSPLQWGLIDNWVYERSIKRVFLAGDYNQAIYTFAGARPDLFKNYPGQVQFIPITHRLGQVHLEYSKLIIKDPLLVKLHTCSDSTCQCGGLTKQAVLVKLNKTQVLSALTYNFINGRETFCLFRTNKLMGNFMKSLILAGIPFKFLAGLSVWTFKTTKTGTNLILLNNVIQRFRHQLKNFTLTFEEFLEVFKNLKARESGLIRGLKSDIKRMINKEPLRTHKETDILRRRINLNFLKNKANINLEMIKECFINEDFFKRVFNLQIGLMPEFFDINPLQFQALKFSKGYLRADHIKIELSTIHRAKGQERTDVFLFTDINKLINENMKGNREGYEEEQRVFYVGSTRVKERLFICENFFTNGLSFPMPGIKLRDQDNVILNEILKPVSFDNLVEEQKKELENIAKYNITSDGMKNIILDILYESVNTAVHINDIYSRLEYSQDIINETIEELMNNGEIYEPKPNYFLVL